MIGLASRPSFENMISYNPTFVSAAMICLAWEARQGRGIERNHAEEQEGASREDYKL